MPEFVHPELFAPADCKPLLHPCLDENGKPLPLRRPSLSTPAHTWTDSTLDAVLSRTAPVDLPEAVCGRAFDPTLALADDAWQWLKLAPEMVEDEPDFVLPPGYRATSGCVVIEPDARVWIVFPSNQFGGLVASFPKGRQEPILSLAQNAAKETWEETGLMVRPFAHLCDIVRTKVVTRYYLAERTGGSPALAGWESQAVGLIVPERLGEYINKKNDQKVFAPLAKWLKHHRLSDVFVNRNL